MFVLLSSLVIGGIIVGSLLVMTAIILYSVKYYNTSLETSYALYNDKDILLYIDDQLDKIVSSKMMERKFNDNKSRCATRLRLLHQNGLLKVLYNRTMTKYYYTLVRPITKSYDLELSNEPFMTLEDLLKIFKHYDYKVTMQELILVTGLPMKVIKREMKYFEKEKIARLMYTSDVPGVYQQLYMLNDPYRTNPEAFLKLENVNLELEEIYEESMKNDLV